jgi:hypothetical protein
MTAVPKEDFDIHAKQDLEGVERKWKQFQEENDIEALEQVDERVLTEAIQKDLGYVSKMTVQEYTLFQKWQEVHRKFPTTESTTLYGTEKILTSPEQRTQIDTVRNNIWIPESPEDYDKLEPVLEFTDDSTKNFKGKAVRTAKLSENWNTLRTFLSTMKNNSNIGRQMFFIVKDNRSGKYLGVICISGDFMDLTPRDKFIGWDRQIKTFEGKINHTAIGSSIVPTQPLGYNFTGGKLLAYLCLSDEVQKKWKEKYKDTLVGVTTTSLYGKAKANTLSQYDGLKYWKRMGFTTGSVSFQPSRSVRNMIWVWLKKNHTRKYWEWHEAKRPNGQPLKRDHKNRALNFTYSKLSIPKDYIRTEHQRGIYFTKLYENTNEFLCGKIEDKDLIKRFDSSTESLVKIWKEKHAKKRVKSLVEQGRYNTDVHFYDDLIYMNWEECKNHFLKDVGR